jgi:hypothetical protein
MIIGIDEARRARIYGDMEDLRHEWGAFPSDVLSETIRFYDEDGKWLKPEGIYKPRWWLPWSKRLVDVSFEAIDASSAGQDDLAYLLAHETHSLGSNVYVRSLAELQCRYPYPTIHAVLDK